MAQLVLQTPIGKIAFWVQDNVITKVDLNVSLDVSSPWNDLTHKISEQVVSYFSGKLTVFDLPICVPGTDFRKRVWAALSIIPFGTTLTYGELANQLTSSARAIGGACRHNPTPLIVPCHRIVAASGIGGFAGEVSGQLVDTKQWLLRWESQA